MWHYHDEVEFWLHDFFLGPFVEKDKIHSIKNMTDHLLKYSFLGEKVGDFSFVPSHDYGVVWFLPVFILARKPSNLQDEAYLPNLNILFLKIIHSKETLFLFSFSFFFFSFVTNDNNSNYEVFSSTPSSEQ